MNKLKMRFLGRNEDVLKLVHPGKHVEIYREPVVAADIMNKYPRHCIARPDVFKFPWIVVSPESVLALGNVFYIVPDHTIYNLLKAKKHQNHHFPQQYHSPDQERSRKFNIRGAKIQLEVRGLGVPGLPRSPLASATTPDDHRHYCQNSSAGTTPKRQGHGQCHRRQSTPWNRTRRELDSGEYMDHSYADISWNEVNVGNRNGHQESYQGSQIDSLEVEDIEKNMTGSTCRDTFLSSFDPRRCIFRKRHCNGSNVASRLPVTIHGKLLGSSSEHVELKSCLRKQNKSCKLLNPIVTFGSAVMIPTSPRESPSLAEIKRAYL